MSVVCCCCCVIPCVVQMIEMKLFADINKMHPIEIMTMESNTLSPEMESRKGWLKRLFKFKRQVGRLEVASFSCSSLTSISQTKLE